MSDGVATWLGRARAWLRRHPWLVDSAAAIAVLLFIGFRREPGDHHTLSALLGVLLCLPLIARRRFPVAVFSVVAVVALVQWAVGRAEFYDIAMLIVLYSVAAYRERMWALIAWGVLELGVLLAVVKWIPHDTPLAVVFLSGLATTAFVLGRNTRTRRAYLASLEDRARRAEHERDQQAQLAAAAERTRIAREMHDIVTHNLSVMIALADGAAFAARDNPVKAHDAARQVSATGRAALTEMHRLLGVLRGNSTETMRSPQPGIDQLDQLATQVRAAGLPVTLTVAGTPFPVSPTAQLAAYRVVQEALTNVLKHASSPTTASVTVCYRDPVLEVAVDDDGDSGMVPGKPAGHGLDGMAERVAMFDGELRAGPRAGGGWRVSATLCCGQVV
jgi:signal transduction histidine kinase